MKNPIKNLLYRFVYNTKMSHKFIILIIFMIVIPVTILGYILYDKLEKSIIDEIDSSYLQIATQYVDNINYKLNIFQNLMENIIINHTIQEIYTDKTKTQSQVFEVGGQVSEEIESLIYGKNTNEIHAIRLYSLNDEFPEDGRYISNIKSIKDEPWYDDVFAKQSDNRFFISTTEGLKRRIISFTKPIINQNDKTYNEWLGFVKLDIDVEKMFNISSMIASGQCEELIIEDSMGGLIISGGESGEELQELNGLIESSQSDDTKSVLVMKSRKKIIAYREIGKYGMRVLFIFPYADIENKMQDTLNLVLVISLVLLLFVIGIMLMFSGLFSRRLIKLIGKMKKVQSGELVITDMIQGRDEIGTVDTHFNTMVGQLRELIKENYVQKLERKEAELSALQMQINPHFLFNTLEAINSISSLYGCMEICMMSQNLGKMFRYSIGTGKNEFVRLYDEMQSINNYIAIQSVRFENRFEVIYNIPEEHMTCRIIKFTLQPIVENVFIHGFKGKKDSGRISISTTREDDRLTISVEDNGNGIKESRLSELKALLEDNGDWLMRQNNSSLGIQNVNFRIRLTFGEQYGLSIDSIEGSGTRVRIVLPYRCTEGQS